MSDLKKHLESRPDITVLYVSKDGAWLRYPRPGFEKKTRDELLKGGKVAEQQPATPEVAPEVSKPAPAPAQKPKKK